MSSGVANIRFAIIFILLNFTISFTLLLAYAVQVPLRYIQRRLHSNRRRPPRARVFVTTNESQRDDGDAHDTVVLVHGFPDGPALWRATVRRLTALGYRCLVVALPGCRGQIVEQPIGIDVIVDQLHDAIVGELETAQQAQAAQQHGDEHDDDEEEEEEEERKKQGEEGQQENNENEGGENFINNDHNTTTTTTTTSDGGVRRRRRKRRQKSVTVIAHDWGVAFTHFLQQKYPDLVHRVVFLDVGQINKMPTDLLWRLCIISYQLMFACCYLVGNPIGTFALRTYATLVIRYDGRPVSELRSDMAWMYVTFLQHFMSVALAGKKNKKNTGRSSKGGGVKEDGDDVNNKNNDKSDGGGDSDHNTNNNNKAQMPPQSSSSSSSPSSSTTTTATRPSSSSSDDRSSDRPSSTTSLTSAGRVVHAGRKIIPTLFIYGRKKLFNFHEDKYVERVRGMPHSVAEAWGCGHWIQREKETEWLSTLGKWLESTHQAVSNGKAMGECSG